MPQIGERITIDGVVGEWDGQTWREATTPAPASGVPNAQLPPGAHPLARAIAAQEWQRANTLGTLGTLGGGGALKGAGRLLKAAVLGKPKTANLAGLQEGLMHTPGIGGPAKGYVTGYKKFEEDAARHLAQEATRKSAIAEAARRGTQVHTGEPMVELATGPVPTRGGPAAVAGRAMDLSKPRVKELDEGIIYDFLRAIKRVR